jgi:hypothetical protein
MLERPIAAVANLLVSNLRNHVNLRLSPEEFRYSRISFSQFGEDLAVLRWLDDELGSANVHHIYVDAGCFHPIRFSNTLLLNKRGWRGINIDMSQHKIDLFNQERQRDFNVCAALSDKVDSMECLTYGIGLTDRLSHSPTEQSVIGEEPIAATAVTTTTLD